MISNSNWLRGPLLTFGGTSMTIFLLLTFYSNFLSEYENSSGNDTSDKVVSRIGLTPIPDNESTTFLPDEYYVFGENGTRMAKSECRRFVMVMLKRTMKHLVTCLKKLKKNYPDKDEFLKRFGCATKCFMLTLQFVEPTGYFTRQTFQDFLNKNIPIRYHAIATPVLASCIDTFIPLIDPDDPYCIAYSDMFKCFQNSIDEKCRPPSQPVINQ